MIKSSEAPRASKAPVRKLSPELREFLHMLQALEGQLAETAPAGR